MGPAIWKNNFEVTDMGSSVSMEGNKGPSRTEFAEAEEAAPRLNVPLGWGECRRGDYTLFDGKELSCGVREEKKGLCGAGKKKSCSLPIGLKGRGRENKRTVKKKDENFSTLIKRPGPITC